MAAEYHARAVGRRAAAHGAWPVFTVLYSSAGAMRINGRLYRLSSRAYRRDDRKVARGHMKSLVESENFPLTKSCAYLNAANVALMPASVADAINAWQMDVALNGSIHFDDHAEERAFDGLRVQAARLFSCNADDIAGGSSCTELLNSIAWAVAPQKHENVVSTDIVFPSTVYPWYRVSRYTGCEMRLAKGQDGCTSTNEVIALIDDNTAVVSISHAEYTGGQLYDLASVADAAHASGALLVVDATQSAGAIPIDAPASGADVIISGSYKWLCGPFGAAVMYLAPHLQNKLEPGFVGFRSHKNMWDLRADRLEFPGTSKRFECSTMAFGCIQGLEKAIEYLLNIGVGRIRDHNMKLANRLASGLDQLGAEILSPLQDSGHTSIITCRVPGRDSMELVEGLKKRKVIAQKRQEFVRFSPHLYNSEEDVDRAIAELTDVLRA